MSWRHFVEAMQVWFFLIFFFTFLHPLHILRTILQSWNYCFYAFMKLHPETKRQKNEAKQRKTNVDAKFSSENTEIFLNWNNNRMEMRLRKWKRELAVCS